MFTVMEVRLAIEGTHATDSLVALHDWLRAADELRGRVHMRRPSPAEGRMGAVADVLTVAVGAGGAGGALTVLAASVSVWLKQPRPAVQVTVERPDGTRVEINGEHLRDTDQLETLLRLSLHDDES